MRPGRWRMRLLVVALLACACVRVPGARTVAAELERSSPAWVAEHSETFGDILEHTLSVDAYVCVPSPEHVFHARTPPGSRTIHGTMPHYDLYHGPMHYRVQRLASSWLVRVRVAVEEPSYEGRMELADCEFGERMEGDVRCSGTPYSRSGTLEICPDSGRFSAPVTQHNVRVLLERWSLEAEEYYNRDAREERIPVRYDFDFALVRPGDADRDASLAVPLATTCARTPYFQAFRSGWSLPIVAHEVGHVLGLLDEYEMFSGIVGFYPKTPFEGAERSRMGLSMKEDTVVLPMHHYLVLRRYFCPEPDTRNPYEF